MSTVATTFSQRLAASEQALDNHQLIDTSLNSVSKWSLSFLGRWLIQPLYWVCGGDSLAYVRINNVAKSLFDAATIASSSELTAQEKERLTTILNRLLTKSTTYSNDVQGYIRQVENLNVTAALGASLRIPHGTPLAQTAANNAYNIHCMLAKTNKSFFFSPVAATTGCALLITGATGEKKQDLIDQTGLTQANLLGDLQSLQATKSAVFATYLAPEAAPQFTDGVVQALKDSCSMELVVKGTEKKGRFARINEAAQKRVGIAQLAPSGAANFTGTALLTAAKVTATLPVLIDPAKTVTRKCTFSATQADIKLTCLPTVDVKKFDAPEYTLVELPYQNGLCKIMIIPKDGQTLASIMPQLQPEHIQGNRDLAQSATVNLYMPRQTIESKSLALGTVLSDIGVKPEKLFDETIHSITTACRFEEVVPTTTVAPSPLTSASDLYIDRGYYFLIMDGDTPVVQGQLDSSDGTIQERRISWFG